MLQDVTLGQVGRGLRRYLPFTAVAGCILLISLFVPGKPKVETTAHGEQPSDFEVEGSVGEQNQPEPADLPGAVDSRRRGQLTPERAKAAGLQVAFGPECDLATGRIRVPSKYAPPCVPSFSGDNGGTTYKQGVTAKEIVVVVYEPALSQTTAAAFASGGYNPYADPEATRRSWREVADYFKFHYETFAREIKFVFFQGAGEGDPQAAKADAIKIATEHKAFATILGPLGPASGLEFAKELAARGVLCIFCITAQVPSQVYTALAPYAWTPQPTLTNIFLHNGEYIGKRLWSRHARWAGDITYQQKNRSLAVLYQDSPDNSAAVADFDKELGRYGARLEEKIAFAPGAQTVQEQARPIIAKLKEKGITTVVLTGGIFGVAFFTKEATNQQYFPEWIPASPVTQDPNVSRTADQTQWDSAFGLSIATPPIRYGISEPYRIYSWHHGRPPADEGAAFAYYPQLHLFTGIHLAGPKLNPQSFRDGMFAYRSSAGGPATPYISFGRHGLWPFDDYGGTDDSAEFWWDLQAQGRDASGNPTPGTYRFVDGGSRRLASRWPTTEPRLFDPNGTVTTYDTLAPDDQPPTYQHAHNR